MSLIKKITNKIFYPVKIKRMRRRLTNRSPIVLASNCNGGVMLHDLGLRFDTPTINLFFLPKDYIKFVSDPQKYFNAEITETKVDKVPYPVGILLDIRLFFMHYKTFEEAKAAAAKSDFIKNYIPKNIFDIYCK